MTACDARRRRQARCCEGGSSSPIGTPADGLQWIHGSTLLSFGLFFCCKLLRVFDHSMESCSIPVKRCLLSVHNVLCSVRSYVPPKDQDTPKHCDMLTLASSERPKRLEIKIADVFKAKKNKTQLNIIIVYREKKIR